jgi:putative CocE/NonD family hydrolase
VTSTATRAGDSAIRTAARRAGDRVLDRLLRLPAATADYTVTRGLRVPMRDGIELLADHYAPATSTPEGTLLVRGPYGRSFPFSIHYARLYAARGYHVVVQSVRGTFGSTGTFVPMVHEAADGADTVAWLREQPWFTGSFATLGLSYLGFTQWALLSDPPPELAAAVITVGPHDFSASSWGTGSFSLNDFLGWSEGMAHQTDGVLRNAVRTIGPQRRLARAIDGLPLGRAGRDLLGTGALWYEGWVGHPDRDDPFWEPLRFIEALDRTQVPVLLISGWQDLFLDQTLQQYEHLRRRGADVALTVGPWNHAQMMKSGAAPAARETLDWLGAHLSRATPSRRKSAVRIFINGHGWLDLPNWPPTTGERVLNLRPGGGVTQAPPPVDGAPSRFTYDPADPTPTVGGRLLAAEGGYRDDSKLAQRADVLSFTGDVLGADLFVVGTPVIELAHTSDNPHVDLFVRISEVDAKGRSRNVSDGYRRLTEPSPDGVRLELDAIAHRFGAGSRIRVLIAGGCHPRFARNLGTGEPPITAQRMVPATHTVHHGAGGVSRLVLPASPSAPSPDAVADPRRDLR